MSHRTDTRVLTHADAAWDGGAESVQTGGSGTVDAPSLQRALAEVVEGEVRFDTAARAAYAHDASHYRQAPIGVVVPRHERDVVETVRICREYGAPILARGGGTSLAGQCCNVAVVLDFTKYMNDVLELDPERKLARVQPGCILDDLRDAAAPHGLTFGPDPATHNHCTIGGMIGNNSCGVHSVMSGFYGPGPRTEHQVESMRVLTYDGHILEVGPVTEEELEQIIAGGGRRGEIHSALRDLRDRYADEIRARFPDIPRRVSGYNLPSLLPENGFDLAHALVGSESTCVIILDATVRLMWKPEHEVLVVLGYDDAYEAGDRVPEIMAHKPVGLEGMDHALVSDMRHKKLHVDSLEFLPDGNGYLLVEFGADTLEEANAQAERLMDAMRVSEHPPRDMKLYADPETQHKVWTVRESGLGATAWVAGKDPTWEGWEDSAVPPEHIGDYLRDLQALLDRYGYVGDLYGHFGQGCVHTRISFDHRTREGLDDYARFIEEAADIVVGYGGSISGEHGDGQARGALLGRMFGEKLVEAFREFKRVWDPDWRMNPGKLIDAYGPTENMMTGTGFNPPSPETHFHYRNDIGGFASATLRCVGVGECRRDDGGVMCPSYMVTREEIHSTRGRARLLFEMMHGEVVTDGWKSDAVKESLDLCLSCKGCKNDCPVDVDMATYKAEFLSHYYEGRLRPRHAYAMGWIHWWARAASRVPRLANWAAHAPGLSKLAKGVAGLAQERELPVFADRTLRDWFHREHRAAAGAAAGITNDAPPRADTEAPTRVILWPDTFNNFFNPGVGQAAVEVLERLGYQVVLPETMLCCGRPLYDFGFLGRAKRLMRRVLDELAPEIRAGTPVIGLEPSCVATFRDEAIDLFPHDEDAHRLSSQTYVLGEFLEKYGDGMDLPRIESRALVHVHCHYHSVMDWDREARLLDRLGLDWSRPEQSCCGMAGAFGFEADKYDVSVAIGERHLLPAVRDSGDEVLLLADGFSCREQVRQLSGREPMHLAELLHDAMDGTDAGSRRVRGEAGS